MSKPSPTLIRRITHIDNVPWILEHGLHSGSSNVLDSNFVTIGNRDLISSPFDVVDLDARRLPAVETFLATTEAAGPYAPVLRAVDALIDGFQTPYLMELLATVDWILYERGSGIDAATIREDMKEWPGGPRAAARKLRLFDERSIELARERLVAHAGVLYPSQYETRSTVLES